MIGIDGAELQVGTPDGRQCIDRRQRTTAACAATQHGRDRRSTRIRAVGQTGCGRGAQALTESRCHCGSREPGAIPREQRGTSEKPALVAVEAAGLVAMEMLEQDGILTIGAVSMPGSAPVVRLMMYPDGHRLGVERIAASLENGIGRLSEVIYDADAARDQLLGR